MSQSDGPRIPLHTRPAHAGATGRHFPALEHDLKTLSGHLDRLAHAMEHSMADYTNDMAHVVAGELTRTVMKISATPHSALRDEGIARLPALLARAKDIQHPALDAVLADAQRAAKRPPPKPLAQRQPPVRVAPQPADAHLMPAPLNFQRPQLQTQQRAMQTPDTRGVNVQPPGRSLLPAHAHAVRRKALPNPQGLPTPESPEDQAKVEDRPLFTAALLNAGNKVQSAKPPVNKTARNIPELRLPQGSGGPVVGVRLTPAANLNRAGAVRSRNRTPNVENAPSADGPPRPPKVLQEPVRPTWSVAKFSDEQLEALEIGNVVNAQGKTVPLKLTKIVTEKGIELLMTNSLHKGSFGLVHYAITSDGDVVAVKKFRLQPKAAGKGNAKTNVTDAKDFYAEVEVQSRYQDVEYGQRNGKGYAVSRLGQEVDSALLHMPDPHRQNAARSVLAQMAAGLERVHKDGRVHADVKLQNVLVYEDGEIQNADYGLTQKIRDNGTAAPKRVGTRGYMAPEVHRREEFDGRADVWSLGFAFADAHLPWSANPLIQPHLFVDDAASTSAQKFTTKYEEFDKWHAGLFPEDSLGNRVFNAYMIKAPGSPGATEWDNYFGQLAAKDPVMCHYVLEHMLQPKAERRADMSEVRAFTASLMPAKDSDANASLNTAWQDIGRKDTQRQSIVNTLKWAVQYLGSDLLNFPKAT